MKNLKNVSKSGGLGQDFHKTAKEFANNLIFGVVKFPEW